LLVACLYRFCLVFFGGMGFELRVLHLLGRHSIT
jgi:hypothetical protein